MDKHLFVKGGFTPVIYQPAPVVLAPGAYDENDNLLKSWAQLVSDRNVGVTNGGELNTNNIDVIFTNANAKKVVIDQSVTSIGSGAFKRCTSLTSIIMPDGVTSIGNGAFTECANIPSITIPNSVTSIGSGAFSRCTNLTTIAIPNGVTSIGKTVFTECTSLTTITIPDGVTSIGDGAFDSCTSLTSITIPDGVTSIGIGAFYGCTNLTTIYYNGPLDDATVKAGSNATVVRNPGITLVNGQFRSWDSLVSPEDQLNHFFAFYVDSGYLVRTPSGEQICKDATKIVIGDYRGIQLIGPITFTRCPNLTSVTIPYCVTAMADDVFEDCPNLTTIYYAGTATGAPWGAANATVVP